MANKPVYGLS